MSRLRAALGALCLLAAPASAERALPTRAQWQARLAVQAGTDALARGDAAAAAAQAETARNATPEDPTVWAMGCHAWAGRSWSQAAAWCAGWAARSPDAVAWASAARADAENGDPAAAQARVQAALARLPDAPELRLAAAWLDARAARWDALPASLAAAAAVLPPYALATLPQTPEWAPLCAQAPVAAALEAAMAAPPVP